ncbi:MAG: transcriptional regulator, LuxR family [Actinomycetia bacterium]|nr:transcriptional regulator, LuxR family [Actinomycetes bacterium]
MATRVSSPAFIGRGEPLDQLEAAVARAATGEASAVVVGGEAGVGKTRLVRELATRAGGAGGAARVLSGTCIDLGEGGPPFGPMVEVLRTLVREDGAPAVRAYAGPAAAELGRLVSELAAGEQNVAVEPSGGATRLFEVVLGLLERLALDCPLLLIIEDLHWADRSTRDLLAYLIHQLGRAPVAIVMTFRTDELSRRHPLRPFLAELERSGRAERIDLDRFDRGDVAAQLHGILGEPPPPEVVEAVFARSDGNAFFTEELVAAGRDLRSNELPPSLRDVLLVRVEMCSDAAQELLRIAAAAGRTFDHDLLAAVADRDDAQLREQLREAIAQQLIEASGDHEYTFRHALLQEALYDELLPGERVDVHAAYARTLSEQPAFAGGDRAGVSALLAHHWYASHELTAALAASIDAAIEAERVAAVPEARQHYERALSLWSRAPGDRADLPLDHLDVLHRLADAEYLMAEYDRALHLVDIAIAEARATDDPLRVSSLLVRRGRYLWANGAPGPALATYEEALATCPASPPTVQRARALSSYGQALMLVSRNREAAVACREAIDVAAATGDRATGGHARNTLGTALGALAQFDEGIVLLREALAIAQDVDNVDDICRAYTNLSEMLLQGGRLEEGLNVAQTGAAFARQLGFHRAYGSYMLANGAMISFQRGDWDDVEEATSAALALGAQIFAALRVNVVRARLLVARGDLDGAEHHLAPALAIAVQANDVQHGALAHVAHAELLAARGARHDALAAAALAVRAADNTDDSYNTEPAIYLGVAVAADLADEARAHHDQNGVAAAVELAAPFLARADATAARAADTGVAPRTTGELATIAAERRRLDGVSDVNAWHAAVDAWRSIGEPYPEARARVRLAEALLATQAPRSEIEEQLRASAAIADALRATPLRAHVARVARWARVDLDSMIPEAHPAGAAAVDQVPMPFSLTPRERQVLAFVADGRTNRQIADALFINEKTASVHVSNILSKLGVANRGEAAAVAHRVGLANE